MERRRVRYTGRVQGVGFRATTRWIAWQHPVTGWVRNEEDGGVVLEAQGDAVGLESFLKAVRDRFGANIIREDADSIAVLEGESGFDVRR